MVGDRRRDERGAATLFVLGLCVAVLFIGGLSVDFWRLIAARRSLAAMADAAAAAGASGLDEASLRSGGSDLDPNLAHDLAVDSLAHADANARIAESTVDTTNQFVDVVLSQRVSFTFLGLLSNDDGLVVRVSARAEPRRVG